MGTNILGFGLGAALLFAAAGAARAGFDSITTDLPADVYSYVDTAGGALSITAPSSAVGSYDISVQVNSDPWLNVWESITNDSSVDWDSYTVTINPLQYVVTDLMPLPVPAEYPDYLPIATVDQNLLQITYSGGIVHPNDVLQVLFRFQITAENGVYGYNVINTPHEVPEPASLAMVGLGAALLIRRRR